MKLLYLFSVIAFISCRTVMGITDIKEYKAEDIKTFLQKNNISDSIFYFVDNDFTNSLLKLTKDSGLIKHHLQPLQASYYNKAGELISFHINCNAPGFPNLNWNYKGVMEVFPPNTQAPLDTLLTWQTHLHYLKSNKPNLLTGEDDFDYYIVVGWAGFMKKQSKVLINAVRKNLMLNTANKKVKIIFVCTDNVFLDK
jgi:hypothetical protein